MRGEMAAKRFSRGSSQRAPNDGRTLTDSRSVTRARFDLGFVQKLCDRHQGGADLSTELWPLVVLELWHKNFSVRPIPEPVREVA